MHNAKNLRPYQMHDLFTKRDSFCCMKPLFSAYTILASRNHCTTFFYQHWIWYTAFLSFWFKRIFSLESFCSQAQLTSDYLELDWHHIHPWISLKILNFPPSLFPSPIRIQENQLVMTIRIHLSALKTN